jgi:hypothetical protein
MPYMLVYEIQDEHTPVAKESATAKIGLERAFSLRPPFVRFVDLLVY